MIIVSPILVYLVSVAICWTWYKTSPRTTNGSFFDFCGHDGILFNFVLSIAVMFAIFSLLLAPISLLLDWRRWKKNNA